MKIGDRIEAFFVGLDQALNGLINGYADETLSAAIYRKALSKKRRWVIAKKIVNSIFFWQEDHCKKAHQREIDKDHLPPHYRSIDSD